MRIDIRFLNRLPAQFVEQNDDLSALRLADEDRDGFITQDDHRQEATQFLRRLAREQGASIEETQIGQASDALMREMDRVAHSVRQVVETQTVSIAMLHWMPEAERRRTHADFLTDQVDVNDDGSVDATEMRRVLVQGNPDLAQVQLNPLLDRLTMTAEGLYQLESNHRYDALPSLLHYATYPVYWVENFFAHRGNWREEMQNIFDRRNRIRLDAIRELEHAWRAHPDEDVNALLARMRNGGHQEQVRILTEDLRLGDWQGVVDAPNMEGRGRAAVDLSQRFRDGSWNSYLVGGFWDSIDEFLAIPWRDNNFYAARSILNYYANHEENPSDGRPQISSQIRNEAQLALADSYGNGGNLWPWNWGRDWSDETASFNNISSEVEALALEILATRGALRAIRWGAGGIWSLTGSRAATWMAGRGGAWLWGARILGYTAPAATEAATEVAVQSAWRSAGRFALRALQRTGRALHWTFQTGSQVAGVMALNHGIHPPGREVNYQIDYSLTIDPPRDHERPTAEDVNRLVLTNLVNIQLQMEEMDQN